MRLIHVAIQLDAFYISREHQAIAQIKADFQPIRILATNFNIFYPQKTKTSIQRDAIAYVVWT